VNFYTFDGAVVQIFVTQILYTLHGVCAQNSACWAFENFLISFFLSARSPQIHTNSLSLSLTRTHTWTRTHKHIPSFSVKHMTALQRKKEILKSQIYGNVTYIVNLAKSWASRMSALLSPSSQYSNSMEILKYGLASKLAVQHHRSADFWAYLDCWSGRRKIWRNYNISKVGSRFVKSRLYGQFTSELVTKEKILYLVELIAAPLEKFGNSNKLDQYRSDDVKWPRSKLLRMCTLLSSSSLNLIFNMSIRERNAARPECLPVYICLHTYVYLHINVHIYVWIYMYIHDIWMYLYVCISWYECRYIHHL